MKDVGIALLASPVVIGVTLWNLVTAYRVGAVPVPFKSWGDLSGWSRIDHPKRFWVGVLGQVICLTVGFWLLYVSLADVFASGFGFKL